jgi:hypothetical protein
MPLILRPLSPPKILQQLVAAQIINSIKGSGGGFDMESFGDKKNKNYTHRTGHRGG